MGRIPDSPEGVALALLMMIFGAPELVGQPRNADEVLSMYRRCLAAVQDPDTGRVLQDLREIARSH